MAILPYIKQKFPVTFGNYFFGIRQLLPLTFGNSSRCVHICSMFFPQFSAFYLKKKNSQSPKCEGKPSGYWDLFFTLLLQKMVELL